MVKKNLWKSSDKILQNRPEDALVKPVKTVGNVKTVEIVETVETTGTVETAGSDETACTAHTPFTATHSLTYWRLETKRC